MHSLEAIAAKFQYALQKREWPEGGGIDLNELTLDEAYEVQGLVADARVRSGERVVGYKVGCTSEAIRNQLGLSEPICAPLFYPHVQEEGRLLDWSAYANCGIEPEMALKTSRDIRSKDPSDQELLDSIAYVSPSIELHNYRFWQGKPSSQELICSGGMNAGLVVGQSKADIGGLRLRDEVFSVYMDGDLITSAPASEIMGGPLISLRWLANRLVERGDYLPKDFWIIPGSPTELVEIDRDVELKVVIDRVGEVVTQFRKPSAA